MLVFAIFRTITLAMGSLSDLCAKSVKQTCLERVPRLLRVVLTELSSSSTIPQKHGVRWGQMDPYMEPSSGDLLCVRTQVCLTLCNPMNCSPQDSSVHGISQARILEWVAISFSRGSLWPIKPTSIASPSLTAGFFTTSTTWLPRTWTICNAFQACRSKLWHILHSLLQSVVWIWGR